MLCLRKTHTHRESIVSDFRHITIFDAGQLLAEADVHFDSDLIAAQLRVESGHLPPGTRTQLVDAILELPHARPGTALELTVPAGDAEMLQRVRERCTSVHTRAAGASCRLNATVGPGS
jgi:hypothetical protein